MAVCGFLCNSVFIYFSWLCRRIIGGYLIALKDTVVQQGKCSTASCERCDVFGYANQHPSKQGASDWFVLRVRLALARVEQLQLNMYEKPRGN